MDDALRRAAQPSLTNTTTDDDIKGGERKGNAPAVSSTNPMVMAAPYVHVRFHAPSVAAATRQSPKATAKKTPDPRFGR